MIDSKVVLLRRLRGYNISRSLGKEQIWYERTFRAGIFPSGAGVWLSITDSWIATGVTDCARDVARLSGRGAGGAAS